MVFLDHLRSISARILFKKILLVPSEGTLLQDSSICRQGRFLEETLDIADPLLQLIN